MCSPSSRALPPRRPRERRRAFPGASPSPPHWAPKTRSSRRMIAEAELDIPIFTLDTGRLYPETYDLIARTGALRPHDPRLLPRRRRGRGDGRPQRRQPLSRQRRGAPALLRGPQGEAAAARADEARRLGLRPAQRPGRDPPEGRAGGVGRRPQASSRSTRWRHGTRRASWDYVRAHDVPYNPLHDAGFPSIGCAPCTRAVPEGEDARSGRWWWESAERRECGLHQRSGQTGAAS